MLHKIEAYNAIKTKNISQLTRYLQMYKMCLSDYETVFPSIFIKYIPHIKCSIFNNIKGIRGVYLKK